MFTGIIEELGKISEINKSGEAIQITITADKILNDTSIGDSISINGVCLTVTGIKGNKLCFDVSPQTLQKTDIGELNIGSMVNLERALRPVDRMGGHFVSGHIDCTGRIINKEQKANAIIFTISIEDSIDSGLIIAEGSIAVDGISLTIIDIGEKRFKVSIIPHTLRMTTLGFKGISDSVNIEFDIIGKYIKQILSRYENQDKKTTINEGFLHEHGFI